MIMAELKHWKEILLEIGEAEWPNEWVALKVNRLFPIHHKPKARAKEALSFGFVRDILLALKSKCESTDSIESMLALRDLWMVVLGYGHLLRKSELVAVRLSHIQWTNGYVLVPRSKTDQAGRGAHVPLLRTFPVLGSLRPYLDKLCAGLEKWT